MKQLKHIQPLVSQIASNQVTLSKKEFDKLINHVNILTDTVNVLINRQQLSEDAIKAIVKSLE